MMYYKYVIPPARRPQLMHRAGPEIPWIHAGGQRVLHSLCRVNAQARRRSEGHIFIACRGPTACRSKCPPRTEERRLQTHTRPSG